MGNESEIKRWTAKRKAEVTIHPGGLDTKVL